MRSLTQHGIDLPFATYQLLVHDQTEASDGDRSRQREGWSVGADEAPQPHNLASALEQLVELMRQSNRDGAASQQQP